MKVDKRPSPLKIKDFRALFAKQKNGLQYFLIRSSKRC